MPNATVRSLPALPSALTHEQAHAFVLSCTTAMKAVQPQPGAVWAIEAAELSHFDSAALAALLAVHRLVKGRGETLQLAAMPQRLHDLATLYGVRDLLPT
ncbi:MAG: STAS domain-containing protein [Burkholderiaceae bacterium]|nr:STAS domain-containing protein [Burkholderiaceae bacterium]